ncbi:hypothetical protein ACFPN2_11875 [Steroidobacter flavus]|uniref:Lipoprotein n=1 Tax=Steroidobacter flavus TaxID=1842136 RepID=A0ABV8SQ83_9GAMM
MIPIQRFPVTFVLVCIGVAGCTPANFIQRVRSAPPCDVRICTNIGASPARCECQTHEQVKRQLRETYGRQAE